MQPSKSFTILFSVTLAALLLAFADPVSSDVKRFTGQTVYVPAYSHIYHGDRKTPLYLTVTLSIRNTDPTHPITLLSVQYFDTDGNLLKNYQKDARVLRPMGSVEYVLQESEKEGGAGANFIIKWKSDAQVTEPITEAVMISTALQQGISFSSRGKAIEEH